MQRFEEKVWLATPTMHGDELRYMQEAYETNWMTTIGKNINEIECQVSEKIGCQHAVALTCGTCALHILWYMKKQNRFLLTVSMKHGIWIREH